MNLLNYLNTNNLSSFEDVKNKLTSDEFNLQVKEEQLHPNLYMITYKNGRKLFENEMIKECRGLILEKETNKIVCNTFSKSDDDIKNFEENWTNIEIEEAIDGTQIRLYNYRGKWICATTRKIDALKAMFYTKKTYYELFMEASVNLNYNDLDVKHCYSFVLCHPDNRIVVKYDMPKLYHVLTRDMETQLEVNYVIPNIEKPITYEFKNAEDMVNVIQNENKINKEGYILKLTNNDNIKRHKIRTNIYERVRELRGNDRNILFVFFSLYSNDKLKDFNFYYPEYSTLFSSFCKNVNIMTNMIHKEYMDKNIHRTITYSTMIWHFKPTVYKLHKQYYETKIKTTKQTITEYLFKLAPAQLCFLYNNTFI
jgi:hypothetical protein